MLAALLLPAGRAADRIGRRECFLAGLVVFGVASLGCAAAPGLPALIACRALEAAGTAVLMPACLGLALSVFPSHQRGTAVGVWAGAGAVAAGSGPVVGGLLVESSWRWTFLINVPVVLAALAAGVAILPRRGVERGGQRPGWRIDGVGTFLMLGAAFVIHIRRHPDRLLGHRPPPAARGKAVVLRDGSAVLIRQIHSADAPLLADGLGRLSDASRQMRFLGKRRNCPRRSCTTSPTSITTTTRRSVRWITPTGAAWESPAMSGTPATRRPPRSPSLSSTTGKAGDWAPNCCLSCLIVPAPKAPGPSRHGEGNRVIVKITPQDYGPNPSGCSVSI